jgi:hypothetical protein
MLAGATKEARKTAIWIMIRYCVPAQVWTLCIIQLVTFGVFYQGLIDLQQLISSVLRAAYRDTPGQS